MHFVFMLNPQRVSQRVEFALWCSSCLYSMFSSAWQHPHVLLSRCLHIHASWMYGDMCQYMLHAWQNVCLCVCPHTGVPGPTGLDEDCHRRSSAKGWYTGGQSETAFSDAFPFLVTCQVLVLFCLCHAVCAMPGQTDLFCAMVRCAVPC